MIQKESILFIITYILGINLTKEMKDLNTKNYKNLDYMKPKKSQVNGKIFCVHGLEE
jgi:hypothetical protein